MKFDVNNAVDAFKDGTKEVAETAQTKTSEFHEKYVSNVVPDLGKYGDAAKFVAEMAPGVSEYNAIREGDWQAFAIAAGIDVASLAIGAVTAGTGYVAVKGGSTAAKAGAKQAAKEILEAGTKKAAKEIAEAGAEKAAKEIAESGAKKAAKELAEAGVEKAAKEVAEAGAEKAAKELAEAGAEKAAKELVETGAEKAVKEAAEAGTEKAVKEATEAGVEKAAKEVTEAGTEKVAKEVAEEGAEKVEKTILKVGDKIDKTKFPEYLDEIEDITKREIPAQQKELIDKALKENDYFKLDKATNKRFRQEFNNHKSELIKEWEKMTGNTWPRYIDDFIDEAGNVLRRAGQPYDAHHIIELCTGGPNQWWNLAPASYPTEHLLIHAASSKATMIFG